MTEPRIQPLTPELETAWDEYVRHHPRTSPYHLLFWRDLIKRCFGHESHYLIATNGRNDIQGCLPLIELRSRLFGHFLVSMPYFNYGGALGDSESIEQALMEEAARLAGNAGAAHVEFRDTTPRAGDWPVREDKVNMHLALPDSEDELWRRIGSKVRAQVRRPGEAARARAGGEELLDDFYTVFARNMRDLGTPVYSRDLFRSILRGHAQSSIVAIYLDDVPVAAGFLVGGGDRLEIPWASSLREHNRLGVNMLLYWEVLKRAVEQGYRTFDFGRSSRDSGTYRFKKQWGAEPVQLHWHYWLRGGGDLPSLSPDNPKYRLAIAAWQRLPVAVANLLGPRIVKSLP